jgi:hypothetical protein
MNKNDIADGGWVITKTYSDNDSSDYHMIGTVARKVLGMARSSRL